MDDDLMIHILVLVPASIFGVLFMGAVNEVMVMDYFHGQWFAVWCIGFGIGMMVFAVLVGKALKRVSRHGEWDNWLDEEEVEEVEEAERGGRKIPFYRSGKSSYIDMGE